MPDTQSSELELDEDRPAPLPDTHIMWMWGLLVAGVIFVVFSNSLGQVMVQNCMPNGSCSWSPDDAHQVALIWRWLGVMAFAAGLVERLILSLRRLNQPVI